MATTTTETTPAGPPGPPSPPGTAAAPARRAALPGPYLLWLAGAQAGLLGDAALYFALGWAASAHGGGAAGLVLTAITVPRTVLVLLGGAVADRFGARRVMLAGDAVMLGATLALAAAASGWGTPMRLLVVAAVVIGTVDAFYLPASGSMPRRLVGAGQLSRALALRQAGGQVAALLGAPLGGVLVALGGLSGAALADAVSFGVVLLVLLRVRPQEGRDERDEREPGQPGDSPGLLREAADGVRLALADPLLRAALLLTGAAAGALLPVVSLLTPLLARTHGWGAGATGLVAGGQGAGVLVVAGLIAWRGALRRAGVGAAAGLCTASAGIALLAWAPGVPAAVAGGVVAGAGSGLFACHLGPLVLGGVPIGHLSRMQALLTLVQSGALVLSTGLLGVLADAAGARWPTALCALATGTAGLVALTSAALRRA
ncbi:MFS transporter [Streptomyces sp. CB01881]|uniref:MFS transporter n=1 Tax=Streptomyces sp. CB01881 TaxID=2078691 RepID=UPI000CDC1FBC|nr:MFS transporter [Streptomyces sp. CB01881]AUY50873.1 MFS transporter [Streptomyces sp. CB01881]TYC74255.1 MFS transporter [Streptomyces sp. CB01881]